MFIGAHVVIASRDAAADRAFLRDILGWPSVDAGGGWLIFALPPAEIAVHPADSNGSHELFLMCDDLDAVMAALGAKQVQWSAVTQAPWGSIARFTLPGGGTLAVYQPRHASPLLPDAAR